MKTETIEKIRSRYVGKSDVEISVILNERLIKSHQEHQTVKNQLNKIKQAWRNGGGMMLVEAIKETGES